MNPDIELQSWKWLYGNTPRFELQTENFNAQVIFFSLIRFSEFVKLCLLATKYGTKFRSIKV